MTQTQLLDEFRHLSIPQQLETIQAAMQILAEQFSSKPESQMMGFEKRTTLSEAARLLKSDYLEDEELTSFGVLDGEPFYAEG